MFTLIIILILLPITVLPLVLSTQFSSAELDEMGICLENVPQASCEQFTYPMETLVAKLPLACGNF